MLSKIIVEHLDAMDEVERQINDEIEALIKNINMDVIISDTQMAIEQLVHTINEEIIMPKMENALKLGKELAKKIKKVGEIVIQDTNDGTINQGVVNDEGRD